MTQRVRKAVAVIVSAALTLGALPLSALAQSDPAAVAAPPPAIGVSADEARKAFRRNGISDDVINGYLISGNSLSSLAVRLYGSLTPDEGAALDKKLSEMTKANGGKPPEINSEALRVVEKALGSAGRISDLNKSYDNSGSYANFQRSAQVAALTAINPAPKSGAEYMRGRNADGSTNLSDNKGVALVVDEDGSIKWNRALADQQRQWNKLHVPGAPFIPESGHANWPGIEFPYWQLRSSLDTQIEALRHGRMEQLQELLHPSDGQLQPDMFTAKREQELVEEARKTFRHGGKTVSVLSEVEKSLMEQRQELDAALTGLDRLKSELARQKAAFATNPIQTEAQTKALRSEEQEITKHVQVSQLAGWESQAETLRNLLNPNEPNFSTYGAAIEALGLKDEREKKLNAQMSGPVQLHHLEMIRAIEKAKELVKNGDTSDDSQKVSAATMQGIQQEYQRFITDQKIIHNTFARAQALHDQVDAGLVKYPTQQAWATITNFWAGGESDYSRAMKANTDDWARMGQVINAIADGNMPKARELVISMHPDAAADKAPPTPDAPPITEDMRADAAFDKISKNVTEVQRTNTWVGVASSVIEFSVGMAVAGGVVRGVATLAGAAMSAFASGGAMIANVGLKIQRLQGMVSGTLGWAVEQGGALGKWGGLAAREIFRHAGASMGLLESAGAAGGAVRAGRLASVLTSIPANMVRLSTGYLTTYAVMGTWEASSELFKGKISSWSEFRHAFALGGEANIGFFSSGLNPLFLIAGGIPFTVLRDFPMPAAMMRVVNGLVKGVANNGAVGMIEGALKGLARGVLGGTSQLFRLTGMTKAAAKLRTWRMSAKLASAEEKSAKKIQSKGVYETIYTKVSELPVVGAPLGHVLMQGDGLLKFFAMQSVVEYAGWEYGYHFGKWSQEQDFGQHLRGANQTSANWGGSYWWAFLPSHSAHDMSQNMDAYHAFAGVKALEAEGRLDEYLNAEPDTTLYFHVPLWKRLLDPSAPDSFRVDTSGQEAAWQTELNRKLSSGESSDAHFMEFYRASLVEDGAVKTFRGLKVGPSLRAAAVSGMTKALLDKPRVAAKFLDPDAVGKVIDGYPVTLEIQEALANAVLGAPNMIGRSPGRLGGLARTILARNVESAAKMEAPTAEVVAAMNKAASKKPADLAEGLTDFQNRLGTSLEMIGDTTVDKAMADKALGDAIRDAAASRSLDAESVRLLESFKGYVDGTYERFNFANNIGQVHARVDRILKGLDNEYGTGAHPKAHAVVAEWRRQADGWKARLGKDAPADLALKDGTNNFTTLIKGLDKALNDSAGLSDSESAALSGALKDMRGAPWVVRDDKGTNMTGWRAEQLKGIVEVLCGAAHQRAVGGIKQTRLYDVIPTGGGKTLVQFVGLLPLMEALADRLSLDRLVYATIPALKAQAMNDFFAFRVVGTRLEFRTPEDIKAEIAQGKLDGNDPASKTMLIGDEADKFLFEDPQTSLGGRAGSITRLKSAYRALDERLDGLRDRLEAPRRTRTSRIVAAAETALDLMSESGGHDAEVRAARVELETLSKARGLKAEEAEASAAAKLAALKTKADPAARDAFAAVEKILAEPSVDSRFKKAAAAAFKKDLVELKLPGDEAGARLSRDAVAAVVGLRSELKALGTDPRSAAQRDALNGTLAIYELFATPAANSGRRLVEIREKMAELRSAHDAAVENAKAALETEPGAPPELRALEEEAAAIERGLPAAARRQARDYADAVKDYYGAREVVASAEREIGKAIQDERPIDALKVARLTAEVGAEKSGKIMKEKASQLSTGAADLSRKEIRARVEKVQDSIMDAAKPGSPGWEARAANLLEAYRDVQRSYSGEENPLYAAMREAQESMRELAYKDGAKTARPGDPVFEENERALNGKRFMLLTPLKMFAQAMFGREITAGPQAGLTRLNAARLLRALRRDPGMPVTVKGSLFWDFSSSLFFPRGVLSHGAATSVGGKGDSWVRGELRNQFGGFFEDATAVYINPRSGRVSARFNGQVMEMDIQTLRYWELQKGADLTLPFRHLAVGGAKDLIHNEKANFLFFSATIEAKAKQIFEKAGGMVLGEPAVPVELRKDGKYTYSLSLAGSEADEFHTVKAAIVRENTPHAMDAVAVNKEQLAGEPKMAAEIDKYLEARKIPKDKAFVVNLNDPEAKSILSAGTQDWLRRLSVRKGGVPVSRDLIPDPAMAKEIDAYLAERKRPLDENNFVVDLDAPEAHRTLSAATRKWLEGLPKQAKGLVSTFCSDTGAINEKYQQLLAGGMKPSEIAVIYSDVQYEMANGDAEAIKRKMNLDGMKTGAVKILLIDSDYVIRGIDLNFKGERGEFKSGDFAGYSHVSMLFFGAQKNTVMQLIQGIGRTAKRRVLPNVRRDLQIGANIKVAQNEPAFLKMQGDPRYKALLTRSGQADWEGLNAFVEKSSDPALAESYDGLVKEYFGAQWENVSAQKLSASGFSEEAPPSGRFPGVEAFMRGGL